MLAEIQNYHSTFSLEEQVIAALIYQIISKNLIEAEHKIWHRHPVWFIEGNPIVGYSKQKKGIRLMFWSGADFEEKDLNILGEKFKDASIFYNSYSEINENDIVRWLEKSKKIQWDYKNLVKRKGQLVRL
ncbi:Protein of unknown function [Flavobacterium indicum GPTSA100-9 = DSM 17447]|uniref:YdhG-like domain-containing protein n=1 Tax=Flavobacterium indicum (strain DSM 17447 / CIP 109464 / GPTSA100-9) TaxID=1094466 RepID=H8XQJ9_FLAIG|nr:DUF1801 domain-containing protein [Flavobacterium indicum]CCG53297.1 Protein of unknown function [Flavobacterium indicum GPTSA100-9 = DSM 17447]